jgi:hypothetical protein
VLSKEDFAAKYPPWIGVDFDGTLAHYDHYRGDDHTGAPVEPMVRLVRKLLHEGKTVKLFTARKPHPALRRWMQQHLGQVLEITNVKNPGMQVLLDDRAIGVERNTGKLDNEKRLKDVHS